ncbi:hypothetical protein [Micromonospora luteifusca]
MIRSPVVERPQLDLGRCGLTDAIGWKALAYCFARLPLMATQSSG